ncbi:hypothetical protein ISS30_04285 [bacterium]|nr:hypothetical protein [FCB group bacterium]MBL7190891.1 hypothetical protein [bacterium]
MKISEEIDSKKLDQITRISRRRTVINASANYGYYAVSPLMHMFLQAYIVRAIGRNQYAIWPLINTVQSFVTLTLKIG